MDASAQPTPLRPARERRLRRAGTAALDPAELLALATRIEPRLCRRLLERPGGLRALAGGHLDELAVQPGIGPARAMVVAAVFELARRVAAAPLEPGWRIRSPADVAEHMVPAMAQLEREELRVLLLNTKNVVTALVTVYVGNLAGSSVRVGEVFRDAVRRQAAAIVVVHNHPSGDPAPSTDDLRITADLAEAGRLLDIELLDHVVVAAEGWASLRALAPLQPSTTTRWSPPPMSTR